MLPNPSVTVIVPVRDAKQENINNLLNSLFQQDYDNFQVILVGSKDDKTWEVIDPVFLDWAGLSLDQKWKTDDNAKSLSRNAERVRFKNGRTLHIVEVELPSAWIGRDTNVKRNIGARLSRDEVLFWTDGKIQHPANWISLGIQIMQEKDVAAIGGEMISIEEDKHHPLAVFADASFIKRNPVFRGGGYRLNQHTISKVRTLPITATWAMTRDAYDLMNGFDERMTISYEDFASAIRFIQNGGEFWVTSEWQVRHKHRSSWKALLLEWQRSGAGAADTYLNYPKSPFSKKRIRDVLMVISALIIGLSYITYMLVAQQGVILLGTALFGEVIFSTMGVLNARRAKHWYGFFFPYLTVFLIALFSVSFLRQFIRRDGAARLLQTVWGYLSLVIRT